MARQSYLKNAAILTGTGLLLRAAGMFFRIYIAARIGAEGMGLYQLIYTVYTCLLYTSNIRFGGRADARHRDLRLYIQ